MHWLAFIPGGKGASASLLIDAGLESLVAGTSFTHCDEGPDGQSGVIVSWTKPGQTARAVYDKAKQHWQKSVGDAFREPGLYWTGVWTDSLPTEAELRRPYPFRGGTVRLGEDGCYRDWTLPKAYELPFSMTLDDDGSIKYEMQRRFAGFFLEVMNWDDTFKTAEEGDVFSYESLAKFLTSALSLNYRLTWEVAMQMRLFSSGDASLIRSAMLVTSIASGGDK